MIAAVDDPAVWTSHTVGGKEGLAHRVGPAHLEGLRELLERTRHLALEDIRRADFDHPAVNELMPAVRRELTSGRGAAILTRHAPRRRGSAELPRRPPGAGAELHNAAKALGAELPVALGEAMQVFSALADSPELRAEFMLEPGEIMFWHNFLVLHSRRAFRDEIGQKRLLLRLWLNVPDGRPMHPAFTGRARAMDFEHENGRPAIDYTKYGTFRPTA